ncbi:MAG: type II secretion system F family protein, partial [Planctomycetia bacterium]|nr:type II secretion system F family protein [Planctomycetia bacterium]
MLLGLIALAIEDNVPLAPLLEEWAKDVRGMQRRRVSRLVRLLHSGRPLADAVEEIPGILADEDLLAIRFDVHIGTRTAAIRRRLAESLPAGGGPVHRARRALIYFAFVLPIAFIFIAFLQLKIVPVFDRMFQEFGYHRPEALRWSITIAGWLASFWWLLPLALFAAIWCLLSTQTGRFIRNSILSRSLQPLRELHAADVLHKLGIATAAGRPLPGALSTLARYHFVPDVRHKLLFVRNEVELGAEIFSSMAAVGLLTPPELRLLKTADRVGNRAWVLDQLAGVKERRTRLRLARAAQLVLPTVVLLLAGVVLFQALTIMVPLVALIDANL